MKYSISDFISPLSFKIESPTSLHYLCKLADGSYDDEFDFDVFLPSIGKNLQRGLVWSLKQKQDLILSMLCENLIPPIYAIRFVDDSDRTANSHKKVYHVIDGKQRFSTMLSFCRNEFPLSLNGRDVYLSDLDELAKRKILYYNPTFVLHYEYQDTTLTDKQKISWFEQLNFGGTPQDIEHLNSLKINLQLTAKQRYVNSTIKSVLLISINYNCNSTRIFRY